MGSKDKMVEAQWTITMKDLDRTITHILRTTSFLSLIPLRRLT